MRWFLMTSVNQCNIVCAKLYISCPYALESIFKPFSCFVPRRQINLFSKNSLSSILERSICPEKPIFAFRRKKNLKNHLVRTDITPKQIDKTATTPCNKCKLCNLINTDTVLVNHFNNRKVHLPSGCICKSKNVIYAAKCKIHGSIYIGHTGEEL